jgi:hypothetical protein
MPGQKFFGCYRPYPWAAPQLIWTNALGRIQILTTKKILNRKFKDFIKVYLLTTVDGERPADIDQMRTLSENTTQEDEMALAGDDIPGDGEGRGIKKIEIPVDDAWLDGTHTRLNIYLNLKNNYTWAKLQVEFNFIGTIVALDDP